MTVNSSLSWGHIIFICILFVSCNSDSFETEHALFTSMSPDQSGLDFANVLTENDSLNYFTYAYLYMGGGVSAGDINNDGLIDLFFTGNMVPNKLYLNKGNMQFEDISNAAGLSGDSRWYTGTTMADINNDGYLDIYCSVGGKFGTKKNQLFVNNKDNTFTEQAEDYGIADPANSVQATFFDYDLDGDLDLYVANYPPTPFNAPNFHYAFKQQSPKPLETDKLYKREGNTYVDVTEQAGLKTFGLSLSATVGDLNQDGYPDLYVSNDFSTPDYLFLNNQDGTFSEEVKQSTKNTSFYGMGVDIADFNNDLLLDILQVDMTAQNNRRSKANMASMDPALFWSTVNAGFHYQYMQNSLQMNNGNLAESLPDFSNISRLAGVSSTDWSWSPLFADLDNDGWKDIYIANGTRREINNRDFFNSIPKGVPLDSSLEKSLSIPSEKIENFVYKNNGDLTFTQINNDWGLTDKTFSNGCVYVDLDNDGDLDIVANNIDEAASVYVNTNSANGNYLNLKFKGPDQNGFGLGVKCILFVDGTQQLQELNLTRGFQSSVAPQLHFGLGQLSQIDSLQVIWPDRKQQTLKGLSVNETIEIEYAQADQLYVYEINKTGKLFETVNDSQKIVSHRHVENIFDDFEKEILLPHQTSMFGPGVAAGDLNGDGMDDLVVGGSSTQKTSIFVQTKNGFEPLESPIFDADKRSEDMGIHIFDVENDGDNDIYIASGGNEFSVNDPALQDRLYINNGDANFTKSESILPPKLISSSRVHSCDYDKDGDLDVFVGGRLVPSAYPSPTSSYLLENKSDGNDISFEDVSPEIMDKIGMVTDAVWTDYDNDGWTDLMLIGEWMPIVMLRNDAGKFKDVSSSLGIEDTRGWWFGVEQGDFDNDGDVDYIVGNLGENYKYKATDKETFDIYFDDFDQNNTNDIVLSYFNEGEKYPVRGRECSSQQMPAIKAKFKNYESFANATLSDIYTDNSLENSLHYQVKSFAHIYLENKGSTFDIHQLPNLAQISSINQISVDDFDKDGNLDAIVVGNLHASEVETPRNDAGIGLLLKGNGKGDFEPVKSKDSGLFVPGDVKDMTRMTIGSADYFVVAKNSDFLQFIQF